MNDLVARSSLVKPTDFDTDHLRETLPVLFIAAPVLKRYDEPRIPRDLWMVRRIARNSVSGPFFRT